VSKPEHARQWATKDINAFYESRHAGLLAALFKHDGNFSHHIVIKMKGGCGYLFLYFLDEKSLPAGCTERSPGDSTAPCLASGDSDT